jgi:branched-chain amino acid transport system permease protein
MDLVQLFQLGASGLAVGGVYALAGLSVALVYRAARLFHLLVGEGLALGGLAMAVAGAWERGILLAFLSGLALGGVLVLLARWLRDREVAEVIVAFLGLSLALKNAFILLFGPASRPAPAPWPGVWVVGEVAVNRTYLVVLGAVALLVALAFYLLERTWIGRRLEAVAEDPVAARVLGLPASLLQGLALLLAGVLGGMAGALLAPLYYASPTLGYLLLLKAVTAAIVGGLLSPLGAVVGGIALGLAESFGGFFASAYRDALVFGLMLLLLVFFPKGVVRERTQTRV